MTSQSPRAARAAVPVAGRRTVRAASLAVLALAAACSDMATTPDPHADLARSPGAASTTLTVEPNPRNTRQERAVPWLATPP